MKQVKTYIGILKSTNNKLHGLTSMPVKAEMRYNNLKFTQALTFQTLPRSS